MENAPRRGHRLPHRMVVRVSESLKKKTHREANGRSKIRLETRQPVPGRGDHHIQQFHLPRVPHRPPRSGSLLEDAILDLQQESFHRSRINLWCAPHA